MLQEATLPSTVDATSEGIAIIGMAGRFPGAGNVSEFWSNLMLGKDAQRTFAEEEIARHVPQEVIRNQGFLRKGYPLDDADMFDAQFFGIPPRQARLMDPQHRLFLECAWEALEHAGYGCDKGRGTVGVFASSSMSSYLFHQAEKLAPWDPSSYFETLLANDKDYLASRVSYKLGLRGPSMVVQSACSSSLLAVSMACQSLQDYHSDMAIAGGVNVEYPQEHGCLCREDDGFISPQGRCRAFDAAASGIVQGNGLGIVVLKRLDDAVRDRDTIFAVIRGFAANNDGSDKVGFTAPSVSGQRSVIAEALFMADVPADSISYVEAHGTGTALGDPIEITALASAYGTPWSSGRTCAVGSVKTNIGHLNTAAGVASLIKTTLALHYKHIPPSLHFDSPNSAIPFTDTPFHVQTSSAPWEGPLPRRAGVSSFGFGGTNVHMILEEWEQRLGHGADAGSAYEADERPQVLPVSAKTPAALARSLESISLFLQNNPDTSLEDVAHTLQCGRSSFAFRTTAVCRTAEEACGLLDAASHTAVSAVRSVERPCVLWFPDMARKSETGFVPWRTAGSMAFSGKESPIEECWRMAQMFDVFRNDESTSFLVHVVGQTAAAGMLSAGRLVPEQVHAQGLGGYAAIVFSGALPPEAAISVAAKHVEWSRDYPDGSAEACAGFLQNYIEGLSLAPVGMPVVSGTGAELPAGSVGAAFWAGLLADRKGVLSFRPPGGQESSLVPLSIVVGDAGEETAYESDRVVVPVPEGDGDEGFLRAVAQVWQAGISLDWGGVIPRSRFCRRIPLPTYPFERQRFVPEASGQAMNREASSSPSQYPVTEWLYRPVWSRLDPVPQPQAGAWLLFMPEGDLADGVTTELKRQGHAVVEVRPATGSSPKGEIYTFSDGNPNKISDLIDRLVADGVTPDHVLDLRQYGGIPHSSCTEAEQMRCAAEQFAVLARHAHRAWGAVTLSIVTCEMCAVTGNENLAVHAALLAGAVGAGSSEYPGMRCLILDVEQGGLSSRDGQLHVLREAAAMRADLLPGACLALRNGQSWGRVFASVPLRFDETDHMPLRTNGVYLITGGLGGVGQAIARHVAGKCAPRLVLTTRHPFPDRAEWGDSIIDLHTSPVMRTQLETLSLLEQQGAEVMVVTADVSSEEDMRAVFEIAEKRFGAVHGVIHAAGVHGNALLNQLPLREEQSNFRPKVLGTMVLDALCRERNADFVLLCSSLAVYGGIPGTADYAGGNAFMDAWAEKASGGSLRVVSVNWNTWHETGLAAAQGSGGGVTHVDSISPEDGAKVCMLALASGRNRLVVCTRRIESLLLENAPELKGGGIRSSVGVSSESDGPEETCRHPRPDIEVPYVAPQSAVERTLADIWAELLELDRVGIDDPFLDIGGDSLMALTLDTELRAIFPVKLPLNLVLNHGTVSKLAEYLLADEIHSEEVQRVAEVYQQVAGLHDDELAQELERLEREAR